MTWDELIELTTGSDVESQDTRSDRSRQAAEASDRVRAADAAVAELQATIDAALAELRRLRTEATSTTED
ncbi:hypothetical protein [Isoptericola sp. b408]|uniref:hypothetical protein n=1 Tax=Isoptericola sp. b408 TaxID=3064653 RepID=UPI002712D513|nr:hypothetical protein [Isoptericola sp. b408]MDO8151408.1 hypothetical protein [Isoptericola sp. b408]